MILVIGPGKCPMCGENGREVHPFTIRSMLKDEWLSDILHDKYFFCANPDCETVYYSGSGKSAFQKDQLKIRVGLKEKTSQRTLCYCFGYTMEDIEREIRENRRNTIPKDISSKIESGLCHCEDANPEGRCCLGNVALALRDGLRCYGANKADQTDKILPTNNCCELE